MARSSRRGQEHVSGWVVGSQQDKTLQSHRVLGGTVKGQFIEEKGTSMGWGSTLGPAAGGSIYLYLKGQTRTGRDGWSSRPLGEDRVTAGRSLPVPPVGQVPPEAVGQGVVIWARLQGTEQGEWAWVSRGRTASTEGIVTDWVPPHQGHVDPE